MKAIRSRLAASASRMLVLGAVLAASGCASQGGRPVVAQDRGTTEVVSVTVENQNFKDATVYAVWDAGNRDRLGTVTGNTTQTFTTRLMGAGSMQVEVDFIAGDDVVTESIGTFEGDHIHVTIPPNAG